MKGYTLLYPFLYDVSFEYLIMYTFFLAYYIRIVIHNCISNSNFVRNGSGFES